jgi:glycosyltransferase involved in cell wall biosynthesis
MAIKVLELELSEPLEPVWGVEGYIGLYALVRYHGRPVGWVHVTVQQPVVPAEQLRQAIGEQLGWELIPRVLGERFGAEVVGSVPLPPISVVICTRDRADQLARCLQALLALDYPDYEIVVVDNASRGDDTARLAVRLPVRYVREERPGLDWARNRGIAEARYDIIAFTDDDARPDRRWLRAVTSAFGDPEVMAVTGLVAPAELETTAQMLFEFKYGGMSQGFRRWVIRRNWLTTRKLLWASAFGVGANMAFRRELFAAIGLFDVALDVGTPSGGGGDVEMFHRLVARGYTLVYEPAALVWHTHRRDVASLRRLVHNNGRSFGAYLLTCGRNRTASRRSILRFAIREWLGWWLLRRLYRPGGFPRRLIAVELAGALQSPLAYRAAQAHAKQTVASLAQDSQRIYPDPEQGRESRLVEAHQRTVIDVS